MSEEIDHPAHYTQGKIEVIEAIDALRLNFCLGNVLKYIARCDYKGQAIKDLRKAAWYLNREIERRVKLLT